MEFSCPASRQYAISKEVLHFIGEQSMRRILRQLLVKDSMILSFRKSNANQLGLAIPKWSNEQTSL